LPHLRVFLLGPPRILLDESPIHLRRRKALALFAYLAVSHRSHRRDALAALLWPDTKPSRAYANLRNLIWILKQNGMSRWLETGHENVELRPDRDLWLDVSEFRERLAASRGSRRTIPKKRTDAASNLARAVELYHDHFMAGFGLGDSVAFDEWQMLQEEALRADLSKALENLVRLHRERKQFDEAIAYSRRLLAIDPLCEPMQRELISLYADAGRRGAALEVYEKGARLLGELGLSPAEETLELRSRVLDTPPKKGKRAGGPPVLAPTPLHNLPAQSTSFVGRAPELAEIRRHLADPGCRLLTLRGPGGSGKTRLALEAAREQMGSWRDGVFFVPLAPVDSPEFIVPAIVEALRAPLSRQSSGENRKPRDRATRQRALLLDYLRRKQVLLVMDNLEHLVDGADILADLLAEAAELRILVTSREKVHLSDERVMEIRGLSFPEGDVESCEGFSAVQLFLECVQRADMGFSPSDEDIRAAGRICFLVEGNPLGIELAASWATTMPPADIAKEIEAGLDFLVSRSRDVPERHRTLRAAFEHSWNLLRPRQRKFFSRLAVFRGRFSREAALEVTEGSVSTLSALLDKSFLRQNPDASYQIHEVLRQYAEEQLRGDAKDYTAALGRLSRHYLARLASLEVALKGPGQDAALEELTLAGDHIRLAWRWAGKRGWVDAMAGAAQSLFLFYDIRSRAHEGAEMFREGYGLLEAVTGSTLQEETARLSLMGLSSVCRGWFVRFVDPLGSRDMVRRGLDLLEPFGPSVGLALAQVLATIVGFWTSGEETRRRLRECVATYEEVDDVWGKALALEVLSYEIAASDPPAGLRVAEESLKLRRRLGDRWGIALALFILGWIAEIQGMPHAAKKRYRESLALRRQMGQDTDGVIDCFNNLGRVARRTGNYDEARQMFETCLAFSREIGNPSRTAQTLTQLGMVTYDLGDYDRAQGYLEEALPMFEAIDDPSWKRLLLGIMSRVAAVSGNGDEARFLLQQASTLEDRDSEIGSGKTGLETLPSVPWCLLGQGWLEIEGGDAGRAAKLFNRALRCCAAGHDHPTALESLIEVAGLRLNGAKYREAAELLSFALEHPALSPVARNRAEDLLEQVSSRLRPSVLAASQERGRRLSLAEIVERIGD